MAVVLDLAQLEALEKQTLAAEGYRFYAQEASEFAAASAGAVDEALKYNLSLRG